MWVTKKSLLGSRSWSQETSENIYFFETGSLVVQAVLELDIEPRMALNSCLPLCWLEDFPSLLLSDKRKIGPLLLPLDTVLKMGYFSFSSHLLSM